MRCIISKAYFERQLTLTRKRLKPSRAFFALGVEHHSPSAWLYAPQSPSPLLTPAPPCLRSSPAWALLFGLRQPHTPYVCYFHV